MREKNSGRGNVRGRKGLGKTKREIHQINPILFLVDCFNKYCVYLSFFSRCAISTENEVSKYTKLECGEDKDVLPMPFS